jgi:hypothetical protein
VTEARSGSRRYKANIVSFRILYQTDRIDLKRG